jgi:succinate dehydrogenase / fumarate reductase, cytochrome b subunit
MSSTAPSKRERSTNSLPSGKGLLAWLKPILASTVGSKFLVAITGLALSGFVIVHMLGNLQIFVGRDALNEYAVKLKDLGPLLWGARLGLLAVFVIHIWLALRLKIRSREARPIAYAHEQTVQASFASRTMVWSGLLIFVFVVFHIAHYTLGAVQPVPAITEAEQKEAEGKGIKLEPRPTNFLELRDPKNRPDVYQMTIYGFTNPLIAVLYILGQLVLMLHLSHGIASTFQSLGLNTPRTQSTFRILGWVVTLLVGGGNIGIVAAVWFGWVH